MWKVERDYFIEREFEAVLVLVHIDGRGEAGGRGGLAEGAVHALGEFLDFTEGIKSHHVSTSWDWKRRAPEQNI